MLYRTGRGIEHQLPTDLLLLHQGVVPNVNLAMSSYAYLECVKRGQTYVSYTLVLDDNWPSRRTGEKLGGEVCGNYLVYRRNFRR